MTDTSPARVVVVDDSALMRNIVTRSLTRAGIEVVGSAGNGDEALALCERERPDAMTLDLTMPGLDGLGVLRALRERSDHHISVVVVSAFSAAHGARAVDALAEGAFDLVSKPTATESLDAFIENLGAKVKLAAASRRRPRPARPAAPAHNGATLPPRRLAPARGAKLVMIATSTGGPRALAALVPKLPSPARRRHADRPAHARRLHRVAGLAPERQQRTERLRGHRRRAARPRGRAARARRAPPAPRPRRAHGADRRAGRGGLRPRADLLIEDAARAYGDRMLLVVLTGMGNDGLRGAREVHRRGGRILVESEESCTVFGMPRAIVDGGLADDVLDLGRLAQAIANEARA